MPYLDPEAYDALHAVRGKNYEAEAQAVTARILAHNPAAGSLLDVACGTGRHLAVFAEEFPETAGVDLSEEMLATAALQLPHTSLVRGDFTSFRLDRCFDAVVCLFSAIGYARDENELFQAARTFATHLNPGGICLVEPWFRPGQLMDGFVGASSGVAQGRAVARASHTRIAEDRSIITFEYVTADSDGTSHVTEHHDVTMFTEDQYIAAFVAAGLNTAFEPTTTFSDRGLITAIAT